MVTDLVNIVLLLVIIWLVAGIRQTMGAPSPAITIRRAVQAVKAKAAPKNNPDNLVPLDQVDPDAAAEAVTKYYKDQQ